MKKTLLIIFLSSFGFLKAQVGIQTDTPQATLDVRAVDPTNPTAIDGIAVTQVESLAPSGNRNGQLVFNLADNQYYYWDGTVWQPFSNFADVKHIGSNNHLSDDAGVGATGKNPGSGIDNIMIGRSAGSNLTAGDNNIFIGALSRATVSSTGSNQLNVGNWIYGNNGHIGIGDRKPEPLSNAGRTLNIFANAVNSNGNILSNQNAELGLIYRGPSSDNAGFITAADQRITDSDKRVSQIALGKITANGTTLVDGEIEFKVAKQGVLTRVMQLTPKGLGINKTFPNAAIEIIKNSGDLTPAIVQGCNVYADNAAAVAAGLPVGGLYRLADGTLKVVF